MPPRPVSRSAALALVLLLAACRDRGLPDERFIATMVALRQLPAPFDSSTRSAADSARALVVDSSRRAAVLARQGVTAAQMEETARALAAEPTRAQEVLAAIDAKLAPAADSAAPAAAAPPAAGTPPAGAPPAGASLPGAPLPVGARPKAKPAP